VHASLPMTFWYRWMSATRRNPYRLSVEGGTDRLSACVRLRCSQCRVVTHGCKPPDVSIEEGLPALYVTLRPAVALSSRSR
jgi:hypothetical protein